MKATRFAGPTPVAIALLFVGAAAGGTDPGDDARIAQLNEKLIAAAARGASGILRITQGDEVYFEAGFGSASCKIEEPVIPEHVFMIGSITKPMTRVLGYVLEEKGYFSLDDTVAELLPRLRGRLGKATVYQLIEHTGGLPDLIDASGRPVPYTIEYDYEPVSKAELIARASLAEPIAEPGEIEEYANLGYQLLAAIYEETTGKPYPELLRRFIFEPAGMKGTDYWFPDAASRSFADGCRSNDVHWGNPADDGMWGPSGPSWNLAGAGGLLSTAESLNRFFRGIGDNVFFETAAQSEKFKADTMVYSEKRRQRIMGPAGSNGIFNAVAFWADTDKVSIILMTNRADHAAEDGLFRDIMTLFPADQGLRLSHPRE